MAMPGVPLSQLDGAMQAELPGTWRAVEAGKAAEQVQYGARGTSEEHHQTKPSLGGKDSCMCAALKMRGKGEGGTCCRRCRCLEDNAERSRESSGRML